MEDKEIERRLDKIDTKLDSIYALQLSSAKHELQIAQLQKELDELKSNKKMWLQPAISSIVSAIISFIIAGGLRLVIH